MEITKKEENKKIIVGIWIFTIVVFGLVAAMGRLPKPEEAPAFTKALPAVNALVNFTCFVVLLLSLVMIKKGNVNLHARLNTFAMILSVIFLLSYVLYHITNSETKYEGDLTGLYYFILASHILLSAVSLPFILFAYYRAWIGDVEKHKKIVKFAYPIWLYVALTGPIVYLFLAPYY